MSGIFKGLRFPKSEPLSFKGKALKRQRAVQSSCTALVSLFNFYGTCFGFAVRGFYSNCSCTDFFSCNLAFFNRCYCTVTAAPAVICESVRGRERGSKLAGLANLKLKGYASGFCKCLQRLDLKFTFWLSLLFQFYFSTIFLYFQ